MQFANRLNHGYPLGEIAGVGNPLADLLQPDLRVLVDLGCGAG